MQYKRRYITLQRALLFFIFSPFPLCATPAKPSYPTHPVRVFGSIAGINDFTYHNNAQELMLLPPLKNYYTSEQNVQNVWSAGVTVGVEQFISPLDLSVQVGVSGYFPENIYPEGHVWQFSMREFDNYTYGFRVQNRRAMLTGKLLTLMSSSIHPYLTGEVGASFNRANHYLETPTNLEVLDVPPFNFTNRFQTSWAYGGGVGIDMDMNAHFRFGIGYQFTKLGKASLGVSPAQETQEVLHFTHFYSNQVKVQLTYVI